MALYGDRLSGHTEAQRDTGWIGRPVFWIAMVAKPACAALHETDVRIAIDAMP